MCLNVGCIPSKALLHTAQVIDETRAMADHGVTFGEPAIDLGKLVAWKDSVVGQLTKGLGGLARQRKIDVLHGNGSFDLGDFLAWVEQNNISVSAAVMSEIMNSSAGERRDQ